MNQSPNLSSQPVNLEFNPKLALKRKERDIAKLLMSDYKIIQNKPGNKYHELTLCFDGPKDTPYEKGSWEIYVLIPDQYPYKSPSIGFMNKIFHPNIDFESGSVCLDVINQTWSPMYELINIFDMFLPQLLTYPNPKDPLNPEAAMLFIKDESVFNEVVADFVSKYAAKKPILLKTNSSITSTHYQSHNTNTQSDQVGNLDRLIRSQSHSVPSSELTQASSSSSNRENNYFSQIKESMQGSISIMQANKLSDKESKDNIIQDIQIKEESFISNKIQEQNQPKYFENDNKDLEEEDSLFQSEQYLSEISHTSCSELSQTELDKAISEY